jgi:hypothetical protein
MWFVIYISKDGLPFRTLSYSNETAAREDATNLDPPEGTFRTIVAQGIAERVAGLRDFGA